MTTSSTDITFTWGPGIRALRGLQGVTQVQLAEMAETTQVTISRIETGSRQVSDALRVRIARALNVNPYDLFPYIEDGAA